MVPINSCWKFLYIIQKSVSLSSVYFSHQLLQNGMSFASPLIRLSPLRAIKKNLQPFLHMLADRCKQLQQITQISPYAPAHRQTGRAKGMGVQAIEIVSLENQSIDRNTENQEKSLHLWGHKFSLTLSTDNNESDPVTSDMTNHFLSYFTIPITTANKYKSSPKELLTVNIKKEEAMPSQLGNYMQPLFPSRPNEERDLIREIGLDFTTKWLTLI